MRHTFTRKTNVAVIAALGVLASATLASAQAAEPVSEAQIAKVKKWAPGSRERSARGHYPKEKPKPGTERTWMVVEPSGFTLKDFTLRGLSDHLEVWVASDEDAVSKGIRFPEGDPRNTDPAAVTITDAQIVTLANAFERRIYPTLSDLLFVPTPRDGKNANLPKLFPSIPSSAYKGDPQRIVVLVDNIRDRAFFEPGAPGEISGYTFYASHHYMDRNMLVLDSAYWIRRLGPNPAPGTSSPAQPYDLDWTLAHEYTHVLQHDRGCQCGEGRWLLEGMAEWGAARATPPGHRQPQLDCFLGRLGACGGPEESLTRWGESPNSDYGAAWSFLETLNSTGGSGAVAALLDQPPSVHGLARVRGALTQRGVTTNDRDLLRSWASLSALDGVIDDGATVTGDDPRRLTSSYLDADVSWGNPAAYARPGAPPNGSDFVRLRDAGGSSLDLAAIDEVRLDGSSIYEPVPVRWMVDEGALHVGGNPMADDAIVRQINVPTAQPRLTFRTRYDIEEGFDVGVVQVSVDGGQTYRSLAGTTTRSQLDPRAHPEFIENLPGYTGASAGWSDEQIDLSPYAGQTVLLSFRYLSDEFADQPGWWIDDVAVGGTVISDGTTLAGWQSLEQIRPRPIESLSLRLVGYDDAHRHAFAVDVPLDAGFDGSISGDALRRAAGTGAETVAAIVTHYEPGENEPRSARYQLTVNGVTQPGG